MNSAKLTFFRQNETVYEYIFVPLCEEAAFPLFNSRVFPNDVSEKTFPAQLQKYPRGANRFFTAHQLLCRR